MRAGRGKMLQYPERDCIVGQMPLQDWVVPVLYQQFPTESSILPKIQPGRKSEKSSILPKEARVDGDYGFIGRGSDIQKLERAIQRQPQAAILIYGQAGIGKTTLAKGFLCWLENTGGLQDYVLWFYFQEIRSAEYIVNQLVDKLIGTSSMAKSMKEKLEMLAQRLRKKPHLLIWDNFESASGIEGTEIQPQLSREDRNILAQLLKGLQGGKTKVLITSRSKEAWLPVQSCYRLPLDGLAGEDLWKYCNAVVRDFNLTVDRNNETYAEILDKLCGNPLAIRVILLRLQDCPAQQLLTELESSFDGMEGDEGTRRLQAAYTVFGKSLTERFLPILQLTGLHEYYADTDQIRAMLNVAECHIEPDAVDACYSILENAGFCTHIGQNIYRLPPALRGYLLRQTPASVSMQEGFVDIMGNLAYAYAGKPLYKIAEVYQRTAVNFYYARQLAETRKMDIDYMALTQCLAYYAGKMRGFEEASKLYTALAKKAQLTNHPDIIAGAFHQLGIIAQEQWDISAAEAWFKKSLAIKEKQGDEHGAALTYHQLGIVAQEQGDYSAAEAWYKKALAIKEKQGDEHGAAGTYYQLGTIAQDQRDFSAAETWYKRSLAISEKQGDEHGTALTYHQLGMIAQEQGDYSAAETWNKKSLAIKEKQGNEHGAANTYHQLGTIAHEQGDFSLATDLYLNALKIYASDNDPYNDPYNLMIAIRNYDRLLHEAETPEGIQLQAWSMCMGEELTKFLEQMEAETYDTSK